MQAKLIIALGLFVATARADATPACRLSKDVALDARVERDVRALLAQVRALHQDFPFTEVALNRAPATATTLGVEIVIDAERAASPADANCPKPGAKPLLHPAANPDDITVASTCGVTRTAPRTLRCSESAIRTIANDGDDIVLRFLLAHELGHIALDKPGQFAERLALVDLSRKDKRDVLANLCDKRSEIRSSEDAADAFASEVIGRAIAGGGDHDAALTAAGHALRLGAEKLRAYQIDGPRSTAWPVLPTDIALPASSQTVDWAVEHALCMFTAKTSGWAMVPVFFGSHADDVTRLAAAENSLLALMTRKAPAAVHGDDPTTTQVDKLSHTVLVAADAIDDEYAAFHRDFSAGFCEKEKAKIACERVPPHPPPTPHVCPGLSAKLERSSLDAAWRPESQAGKADEWTSSDRLTAVAVSDEGTVWATVAGADAAIVRWSPTSAREHVRLPCSPRVLAAAKDDAMGICAAPLRIVRATAGKQLAVDLASHVVAGDEAVASDDLVPNWIGAVDGRWIASLRPPSGTSVDVEIAADVRALPAATGEGCQLAHSGLGLWHLGSRVVGTRVVPTAEAENAELTTDLRQVRSVTTPTPEPLACGPSWRDHALICIDTRGTVSAAGKALGRVDLPASAQPTTVQICASETSTWVSLATPTALEVRNVSRRGAPVVLSAPAATEPQLRCSGTTAIIGFNDHDHAKIIRLPR